MADNSYGPYSHGLYSYGIYIYALYSCALYSYGDDFFPWQFFTHAEASELRAPAKQAL